VKTNNALSAGRRLRESSKTGAVLFFASGVNSEKGLGNVSGSNSHSSRPACRQAGFGGLSGTRPKHSPILLALKKNFLKRLLVPFRAQFDGALHHVVQGESLLSTEWYQKAIAVSIE